MFRIPSAPDNAFLFKMRSSDEIRGVVFDMDPFNAPGPDGFIGYFYRNCWDIVGRDVVRVVQDFFISGSLHPHLNSNGIDS